MRGHRLPIVLLSVLPHLALAQTLDPSKFELDSAKAEQFVRATQQMVASGVSGPSVQSNGALDLNAVKAEIERNPAARAALESAGMSSTDYVLFMGAAVQSAMVGQMEQAGMRGVLPPGVTARPPQANIDFMRQNMDIFTRAVTPGATSAAPPRGALPDEPDLPVPADAVAVLASDLLGRLPRVDTIDRSTVCAVPEITAAIERERAKATRLYQARYGNPGNSGLARTRAEGAVLNRARDNELESCGTLMSFMTRFEDAFAAADAARREAQSAASVEQQEAWAACPGIPGGKEPECERRVAREAAVKVDAAERRYLAAIAQPFADSVAEFRACAVAREQLVRDAQAANVIGSNVKLVLRPLTLTWEAMPYVVAQWSGICESSQRNLRAQ